MKIIRELENIKLVVVEIEVNLGKEKRKWRRCFNKTFIKIIRNRKSISNVNKQIWRN